MLSRLMMMPGMSFLLKNFANKFFFYPLFKTETLSVAGVFVLMKRNVNDENLRFLCQGAASFLSLTISQKSTRLAETVF